MTPSVNSSRKSKKSALPSPEQVVADPRCADLLAPVREAFGDGDALRLLFRQFFPDQITLPAMERASREITGRVSRGDASMSCLAQGYPEKCGSKKNTITPLDNQQTVP